MKLILFDIDGTLIYHVGLSLGIAVSSPGSHFVPAIKKYFGVDTVFDIGTHNGAIDRQIIWNMVRDKGVTRELCEEKFPLFAPHMVALKKEEVAQIGKARLYKKVDGAVKLATLLLKQKNICLGVLTGNVESVAWWKLNYVGLRKYFAFGLFGDEADDRISLAKKVFVKADAWFHYTFSPEDIVIIGDTVHDIRCGKAIGAVTIGVTTGFHKNKQTLIDEHADFVVDDLMDPAILAYFGIEKR